MGQLSKHLKDLFGTPRETGFLLGHQLLASGKIKVSVVTRGLVGIELLGQL